jgi:hypothetical protein
MMFVPQHGSLSQVILRAIGRGRRPIARRGDQLSAGHPRSASTLSMVLGLAGVAFLSHRRSRRRQAPRGLILSGCAA